MSHILLSAEKDQGTKAGLQTSGGDGWLLLQSLSGPQTHTHPITLQKLAGPQKRRHQSNAGNVLDTPQRSHIPYSRDVQSG